MSCISQFSKYIIFIFNFIIAICGIVLIAFGVINIVDESNGVKVFEHFSLGALAISVGVVIFLIASFGCCGAINESPCLLTTYAIVLLVLFAIQTVLGVLAIVKIKDQDDFFSYVRDLVHDLFYEKSEDSIKLFNSLQRQFKCCGVNSSDDYEPIGMDGYPKSCCEHETVPCMHPFTEGCASAFADAIKDNIVIIGYVAIGFAVIELAGAIFAFLVRRRRKYSYASYA